MSIRWRNRATPYETPERPDFRFDTEHETQEDAVEHLLNALDQDHLYPAETPNEAET